MFYSFRLDVVWNAVVQRIMNVLKGYEDAVSDDMDTCLFSVPTVRQTNDRSTVSQAGRRRVTQLVGNWLMTWATGMCK